MYSLTYWAKERQSHNLLRHNLLVDLRSSSILTSSGTKQWDHGYKWLKCVSSTGCLGCPLDIGWEAQFSWRGSEYSRCSSTSRGISWSGLGIWSGCSLVRCSGHVPLGGVSEDPGYTGNVLGFPMRNCPKCLGRGNSASLFLSLFTTRLQISGKKMDG